MSQQSNSQLLSNPASGSTTISAAKPKAKHKIRSISTNKQYNKFDQSPSKLEKIDIKQREKSFVLDCQKFSAAEDLRYDPLLDNNLRLFFYNPRNKQNLIKNGLIRRDGSPVDQKIYRQYLNQTNILRDHQIETFFEKEVVKKHKENKLPPIIKIDQFTPRNKDQDQEEFNTQQSILRKTRKSPKENNNSFENQFPNNFLTPQTKQKDRKSPFRQNSRSKIPRQSSTIDKERQTKNEKMVNMYGYTLESLKEKRSIQRENKKTLQIKSINDNDETDQTIKKEEFDKFMKTLREKYTRSKINN